MPSGLLRNPRLGRVWYPPARVEIPRGVGREDLIDRLYREGGPKHGLRERADAVETLWRGYTYLRLRAELEDSGDFATTAEQTVVGLSFELTRRGAKAWDPKVAEGLEGNERREELLRRRGSALTKLLDELAGAGLLVWGGERDNHGLWWRLRIRLLDPDEERAPDWEPWMRGIDAPESETEIGTGGGGEGGEAATGPGAGSVDLSLLYDRVQALTGHRPRLEARQVVQLRGAVRRFAANAVHRPAGTSGDPLEVLLAQIEHHAPQEQRALAWALARFDGYTRQLEARGRMAPPTAAETPAAGTADLRVSPNCAALFNQQLNSNRSLRPTLACTTGARGPLDEMLGVTHNPIAGEGPGMEKQRTEGEKSGEEPFDVGGLLGRVAAREARLEALSPQFRAQEAQTVTKVRQWPSGSPVPLGLLTEAAQALAGGDHAARPWLSERQVERLRRGERRYVRYADQRPGGSPQAPAAVLIDLVEHAPPGVGHRLAWAIAQLDLLTKRMGREERRARPRRSLRRRAKRRRDRVAEHAGAFYRRPRPAQIEAAVEHLADGLTGRRSPGERAAGWRALEDQLTAAGALPTEAELTASKARNPRRPGEAPVEERARRWAKLSWPDTDAEQLSHLSRALQEIGVGVSAADLHARVRDRLLLHGADPQILEQLKRPEHKTPYTPDSYDPGGPQLTERDTERAELWAWRRHDRATGRGCRG